MINNYVSRINKGFDDILNRPYNQTELAENYQNRILVSKQRYQDVTNAFNSLKDKVENAKSLINTKLTGIKD